MSVLRGAHGAIADGRVHVILLEYGDKASADIWSAMKERFRARPSATTVSAMRGYSLKWLTTWADQRGYDAFMLGSGFARPIFIPLTGANWDDRYEVCRDKRAKYSLDGKTWMNLTAWSPDWSAVCWYDVALVLRESPLYAPLVSQCRLPRHFCERLEHGWYPAWVNAPAPQAETLACTHPIRHPERGEVCTSFKVSV
eukprot:6191776-Pleurochrysis_carterae.AAC.3